MFPDAYIETHASVCGESTDKKAAKSDVADVDLITRYRYIKKYVQIRACCFV